MASFYDHPIQVTYRYAANASLSTTATVGQIVGPKGKRGRVLACDLILTTATTVAASTLKLGTAGAQLDLSVPVQLINTAVQATDAVLRAGADIPADTVVSLVGGGEATAGAADITLVIGWF